jgi:hypothetical protein
MPNGYKCRAYALRDKPYCYFHSRLHRLLAKQTRSPDEPFEFPVPEDRSAIQLALAQVLNSLASSKVDLKRAGMVLYCLQIASQNVDRRRDIVPRLTVESLSTTDDGEEMGPDKSVCEPPEDCVGCDKRDSCPDYEPMEEEEDD